MLRDKVTQLVYPALRYQLITHSSKIARATDKHSEKRQPRIVEYSESADAAYIADHVEQFMELLPELHARKTYDRTVIEMLLNHEAQALREGEL